MNFISKAFSLRNFFIQLTYILLHLFLKKYSLIFRGINFKIIYTSKTECSFHFIQPERNITDSKYNQTARERTAGARNIRRNKTFKSFPNSMKKKCSGQGVYIERTCQKCNFNSNIVVYKDWDSYDVNNVFFVVNTGSCLDSLKENKKHEIRSLSILECEIFLQFLKITFQLSEQYDNTRIMKKPLVNQS